MKKNALLVLLVVAMMSTPVFAAKETQNEGKPFQELWDAIDAIKAEIVSLWDAIETIELTPGPKGDKGDTGATGPAGADGKDGAPGADGYTPIKGVDYFDGAPGADGKDGADGLPGADGQDGLNCWDLDADNICDPNEDVNQDSACDALDCQGQVANDVYTRLDAVEFYIGVIKMGCINNRFCDLGDGTVLDLDTGLIWLKDANCFDKMYWTPAMQAAANLADGQCGLTDGSAAGDWRLPTIDELESLVDTTYTNPTLSNAEGTGKWTNGDAFLNVVSGENWYWSSSTAGTSNIYKLMLRFYDGSVFNEYVINNRAIWPVRDP